MKHHPDLSKDKTNGDIFKQITAAHTILSDEKQRKRYDFELEQTKKFGFRARKGGGGGGGGSPFGPRSQNGGGLQIRPVNFVLGTVFGVAAVMTIRSIFGKDKKDTRGPELGKRALVEAWKDSDGKWKQPQPWSEEYRKLKPKIHLIPREQVHKSFR